MDEILRKISSYNIFNYLLPGTIFAVFGNSLTSYSLMQDDLLIALFLYYFYGLVISRVGSTVIQPLLQKIRIIRFATYSDYLDAEKADGKLAELSEANNMYRTIISLFAFLLGLIGFEKIAEKFGWVSDNATIVFFVLLLVLFTFAYRKQTRYIVDRVNKSKQ